MEETEYYSPSDGSSKRHSDTLSMLCFSSLSRPEGFHTDLQIGTHTFTTVKCVSFCFLFFFFPLAFHMFHDTKQSRSFSYTDSEAHIYQKLYIPLKSYRKPKQVCLPQIRAKKDFQCLLMHTESA